METVDKCMEVRDRVVFGVARLANGGWIGEIGVFDGITRGMSDIM